MADLEAANTTDRAQMLCRDFANLRGRRGNWESHWDEIAERIQPMDSHAFLSRGENTKGDKRTEELFDSTPMNALNKFGAILDSMLTPRNQTWHRLKPADDNLMRSRAVRLYFEEVNRLLFRFRYSPKANFASQNQKNYKSLGAYGTGSMFIDELATDPGLRYRAVHLSEIYFAENHQGIVDKAYRIFRLTARQAVQRWGDKVSSKVKSAMKADKEQEFEFLHAVVPRENRDIERIDFKGMAWQSVYIEFQTKMELEEGGFNVFPYAVSRYEQGLNEVYGRSPAMDSLPAIKTLNEEKKTMLKQGHRAADPVLLTHDDGILDTFSALPGSITAGGVSKDGRPLVHVLPTGSYNIGKDMMDDERLAINDSFLVTLFQILVETPQMSATEVLERAREKGILLAPTVGRQQSEYLGPMIEREVDLLSRQQLLPPLPPEMVEAGAEFSVEYDSPLSRLQRAEEAAGLARSFEEAMAIANATGDPSVFDHYNFDVALPELADIRGVPERWIASAEELAAKRQSRAEAAEQRQAIEAAPSVAALTKATGGVQPA